MEREKIYNGVKTRVTLQDPLVQTSGGGSARSTGCEAHFHCSIAERGWKRCNEGLRRKRWKLNKRSEGMIWERKFKRPRTVRNRKIAVCLTKPQDLIKATWKPGIVHPRITFNPEFTYPHGRFWTRTDDKTQISSCLWTKMCGLLYIFWMLLVQS